MARRPYAQLCKGLLRGQAQRPSRSARQTGQPGFRRCVPAGGGRWPDVASACGFPPFCANFPFSTADRWWACLPPEMGDHGGRRLRFRSGKGACGVLRPWGKSDAAASSRHRAHKPRGLFLRPCASNQSVARRRGQSNPRTRVQSVIVFLSIACNENAKTNPTCSPAFAPPAGPPVGRRPGGTRRGGAGPDRPSVQGPATKMRKRSQGGRTGQSRRLGGAGGERPS